MLRIRENFTPEFHSTEIIQDYAEKWKEKLESFTNEHGYFSLSCPKVSEQVNCIELSKKETEIIISTSYLVGVDYLQKDFPFMVEPKFSYGKTDYDVDYYSILFKSLPYIMDHEDISDLYHVDFSKPPIEINQKDDFLTPILVIQFLKYLENICRKGLQKSYYNSVHNFDGKVKGKILIKETIKNNHLKNRLSKTVCKYQEYGFDTAENQFLKYTFYFCVNYLSQFEKLKIQVENSIGYFRSTLENITLPGKIWKEIHVRKNPMFPSYENALKLANLILKRASFNIATTSSVMVKTYPYWINMSKLFEIHVLQLMRKKYPDVKIYFQSKHGGLYPDIILADNEIKAVIDVKYKPYDSKMVEIEDIRQIAGYSRMSSIFTTVKKERNEILDAVIVYPKVNSINKSFDFESKKELAGYYNIYKMEIDLPIIKNN